MKESWKLSTEEKKRFEEGSKDVLKDAEEYMLYTTYVESQKAGFIATINFVNDKINELIDQGKISDMVHIRARIKAAESAIRNDRNKALDDIFGMEIITATEEEISTIIQSLSHYMLKTKCKTHNKQNGYKAKHKYWTIKEEKKHYLNQDGLNYDNIPMIECQLKTSQVAIKCNIGGTADHTTYKGETKEEIQSKYDNGEFTLFNTPTMWASQNGKMVLLSKDEALKKIYPFLNTTQKKR